jgi:two-component system, NtrC family, response regulator AtoC
MQILVVDDDRSVREMVCEVLRDDGFNVAAAPDGETAIAMGRSQPFDLVFCDVKMGKTSGFDVLRAFKEDVQPDADIILMTGHASLESALEAVRGGARDYIVKPFSIEELSQLARTAMERRKLVREASAVPDGVLAEYADLIGRSGPMIEVFKTIGRVAMTELPVLISGESGTGKEVIARTIHANSPRASHPFVAVDCGALTETLLETELFGHVRGAFTGAGSDRRGVFEEANGGTLMLDEVTETSPAFQLKLVRALQENEVRRVGSNIATKINVRILATTNRDPEALVGSGLFREDLLYRLNVISLRLPPLRERAGDIDLLISAFLTRYRAPGATAIRLAPEAMERLRSYAWPGNVRELRHTMQRLVGLSTGAMIRVSDLPEKIRNTHGELDELLHENPSQDVVGPAWEANAKPARASAATRPGEEADRTWLPLSELERRYLVRVLYYTRGNKKRAAEILGVDRKTLSRMVERHAVNVARIKRDVRGLR